jgi:hypothetical protein
MGFLIEFGPAPAMIIGVMFSILIGALVLLISMYFDLTRVREDYFELLGYLGDGGSGNLLREIDSAIKKIEAEGELTERDVSQLYYIVENCIQKVAVVRFNAFPNVGSDQSYSVALLDGEDNGLVLSGIFGRESSTTYAKPIKSGYSNHVLTDEEERAIGLARKRFIERY